MPMWRAVTILLVTSALVFCLSMLSSCAPVRAETRPVVDTVAFDNRWADSLLVCVQPDLPSSNVTWLCVPLGELRRSLRGVRMASR